MENQHVRALTRFWRVWAAGALVALLVAFLMVVHVGIFPPTLKARAKPTYVATELLILNSASNPYLRTAETSVVQRPARSSSSGSGGSGEGQRPLVTTVEPNAQILVRAANLYPHLVESDAVAALRKRMFGPLPGSVQAEAYKSFQSATRYRPSSFPLIQIDASAHRSESAIRLARATTSAFERWLTVHQAAANVPQGERILVQELQSARSTSKTGGTSFGLPFLVGLVVFGASVGLAIGLDRVLPPRAQAAVAPAPAPAPAPAAPVAVEPAPPEPKPKAEEKAAAQEEPEPAPARRRTRKPAVSA